jgi:hypothetical protein
MQSANEVETDATQTVKACIGWGIKGDTNELSFNEY